MCRVTGVCDASPVCAAMSDSTEPSTDAAGRTAGNLFAQPSDATMPEKSPRPGAQRSVWQPSEVTSLAITPVSRHAQYCG